VQDPAVQEIKRSQAEEVKHEGERPVDRARCAFSDDDALRGKGNDCIEEHGKDDESENALLCLGEECFG